MRGREVPGAALLRGRRILVVEDEYFVADDMVARFRQLGAEAVGPVATVADALALIATTPLDGAVLDLELRGEMAYAVADALIARGVPMVFATGYDEADIAERYRAVPCCEKVPDMRKLARALFG